uniref:Glutamine rich 2 n=1 Tax=Sus scrofa TaxID=9823 RepID=I3LJP1_PIG
MPPATLAPSVSLRELADLAIGTPEVGAVNFTALHTLIVAMLKNLNLQEARINYQAQLPEQSRSFETPRASSSTPQLPVSKERRRSSVSGAPPQALESKVKDLSGQVQDLSRQLKTVESQVQAIVAHMQHVTVQTSGLQAREWLEAKEMDLLAQEKALRESMRVWKDLSELFFQNLLQRIDELERLTKERDKFLELVSRKLSMMPSMEEATMVTWEELEQAITDGWRASQVVSESSTGLPKRRGQSSVTSNDIIIPSGASTKRPSLDQAMESATGLITDKTFLGTSGIGYPSEGVTGRDRSRGTPAPGFPGREQHSRAWDEAGPAKPYHPTVSQFRIESDRHRSSREQHGLAHLRREEQDAHLGPVYQGLSPATLARDWHRGAYISQGPIFARPDQYGLGLLATDQLASLTPSTYAQGVVPLYVGQLGAVPPGMDEQELVLPDMVQRDVVPPLAPSRDEQGLELSRSDQSGVVPLRTPQHGVIIPGTDQRGIRQPGVDKSGIGPLGRDERGLVPLGIDEYGFAVFPMDQQRLLSAGLIHVAAGPQGFVQPGFGTSGFIQPGTEQPGLVQPGASQPGLVQPGVGHPDLVQPGAAQPGLVQPGAAQPGLVQPGAAQPGLVLPGATQPNLVQLGVGQQGLVQPGAPQPDLVQPGAAQPVLVQPGAAQPGLVQPGAAQPGLVQPGAAQPGLVQPGAAQPGLVQPGAAQPGLVLPGAAQPGLVQPGAPGLVLPGAAQPGLVQPGAAQPGLVQPDAAQPGLVLPGAAQPGLVQPGAAQPGLVQPGAAQPGLVQPGAGQPDLVQPGAAQPGLVQPGIYQPGMVQPGAAQPGMAQPGAAQPGMAQPGAAQPGLVQPGIYHLGSVQPGTAQPGVVQPSATQPGIMQPGAAQPGVVQPGAAQPGLVQPVQPGAHPRGFMRPGTDQRGLVQPAIDHRWLRQSATDRGLIPLGTELPGFPTIHADPPSFLSPSPHQHGVVYPGRDQHGWGSPFLASQGLALRGTDQEGLEPREAYQQGLMPPGGAQHGPTPLRTRVGSASQDPQPLETPEPDERGDVAPAAEPPDQARSSPGSQDLGHPGPRGPGYPGVDLFFQVGLDPHETYDASHPRMSIQTTPSHEAAFLGDTPLPDSSHRASSDRSNIQTERHDSLDKLAPSFPMAVETFRLMGELVGLYVELKENMKELDEEQAGQTDLEKLQFLLALMVRKSIPADLQEQVKTLKALTKEVCQEKAKVSQRGSTSFAFERQQPSLRLEPLSCHRVTVADIEKELAELRESQERGKISLEHSVSEASLYLQDQLDKLRTIIENMLASSSKLLSMSISVAPQKTLTALTPGELDPEATCPACSLDLSHQVSMLVQRYEQLQDMVSNLAASRPSKKAKLQSQDEELLGHIQGAILQVQGDCEKLNVTTSSLIEDHRQKQKDIDLLYQGLEKLEKEKANREHLEMEIDVKADKSALAGKVSRVQFDATTEQLNHMMQELVAKMSGQEQDWQKMLDKLLVQMDNKLDRLELDPVRQSLEDRWKSLRQQLKERSPLYQADEAAAMRRQLLAHFHCLSCDRPLETPVTGQVIPVTPVSPGLPGHRSIRPYMVFELEQVRQQSRSLKLGSAAFPRGDLAKTERSVGRLRSMHSKMLMDIEKVQIHFGGSVKASSQMIRELLQAQCLSSPCYKRWTADYTYSTVPRRCGGSHTLTYPYRRSRLQHPSQGLCPTEEIQIAMKHNEVDILGLDGHIYKGRMDTRLPGILSRDNLGILKPKPKQLRPHAHQPPSLSDSGQRLSRPQSARMLAGHNSGSSLWREGPSGWSRHCPRLSSSPAWPLSHPGLAHTFISWREGGPGS